MPCLGALPSNAGCGFLAVDLLQPWLGLLVLPIKNATRHGGRGGDNQLMNAQEPGGGNGARRYPRERTSLSTTNLVTQYDQLLIFTPMAYTFIPVRTRRRLDQEPKLCQRSLPLGQVAVKTPSFLPNYA